MAESKMIKKIAEALGIEEIDDEFLNDLLVYLKTKNINTEEEIKRELKTIKEYQEKIIFD